MKRKIMAFIVLIAQALSLTTIRAENNPSLENSNLERGDLLNWYYNASGSNANLLEIINKDDNPEDVYSGNYSLRVPNISKAWGYNGVTMEGNSAYLVSVMAKANGRTQRASFYSWDSGGRTTDFDILNYHLAAGKPGSGITQGSGTVIGTEWTRVTDVIIAYNSFKPNLSLVDFWNPGEIIIDDLFVEKLRIDDISVEITEEINIPFSGITEITIPKATAKNQLGTTYGLEGANVAYQLNDSYSGVSLDEGNILKISSSVSPGIIELRVTSDPYGDTGSVKYLGVEAYEAIIPVKLLRVENATAELLNKDIVDGVNEIKRDDSFFVKFDYPVNDATITNETIKLINSDTSEEIAIKEFLYNEEDKTVEIVPEADLTSGNYKIVLSKDIRTEDLYEGMTNGWIPLKETIFEFRYFSTNPPVAENVEIIGEGVVGESIYGRYTYKSEENIKENSSYKWYISSEKEGEYKEIPGENGKLLLISEDYQEQFIKFGVTPEDENGYKGEEVLSQAFAMPTVPLAKNVFIGGNAIIGNTLVASYEFVDENGDKEGETIIKWYVSDKKDGEFTLVEGVNGKILKLDESFDGKFIKIEVTPVSSKTPYEGKKVTSEVKGPAGNNLLDSTNLAKENGDVEKGDLTNWMIQDTADRPNSLRVISKEENPDKVCSGDYSLEVGKLSGIWGFSGVSFEKGTTYLVSMMAKTAGGTETASFYSWAAGARANDYDILNYHAANGKEGTGIVQGTGNNIGTGWTRITDVMVAYNSFKPNIALVHFQAESKIYVDDLYVGKLAIADIKVSMPESIDVPASGETRISIPEAEITNQLGTEYGLTDAKAKFSVPENVSGVRVETDAKGKNVLVITEYASVGTLNLQAKCDPYADTGSVKYLGVEPYETIIPIELKGTGSVEPKILEATLSGTVNTGDMLSVQYTFYQLYGEGDESDISWWYSAEKDGEYIEIEGEKRKNLLVAEELSGKYFKAKITPKSDSGEGIAVWTNIVGAAEEPAAKNPGIEGKAFIGEVLTGIYEYNDFNNDKEGTSLYRWLRSDSETGTYKEIEGATALMYVLTEEDENKFIKFEVTPVSSVAPEKGSAVISEAFEGPRVPEVRNVKITKSGKVYYASYDYYQQGGAGEGQSIYKWIVDGNVVSNAISYKPDFSGRKELIFEVTPVSSKQPSVGSPVRVSITVSDSAGSGGGGGGSTGGSAGMISGNTGSSTVPQYVVPSINIPKTEVDDSFSTKMTDIKGHWGYDAILWALNENVMVERTDKTFEPDAFTTRKEIILSMAKILGWKKSEYQGTFEDVDREFGEILQTFVDKGVISIDVKFRPDDNLTRQELAKIMAISLGYASVEAEFTTFADNIEIGKWAIPYVNAVYEKGLIKGMGNNCFSPKTNVTRAQLATLLQRADGIYKEQGGVNDEN